MTIVLIGSSALFWGDWPLKIEVIGVLDAYLHLPPQLERHEVLRSVFSLEDPTNPTRKARFVRRFGVSEVWVEWSEELEVGWLMMMMMMMMLVVVVVVVKPLKQQPDFFCSF